MRKCLGIASVTALVACAGVQACSGDDTIANGGAPDASQKDATNDTTPANDSGGTDVASGDSAPEAATDASDAGCPGSWSIPPDVDPAIAVPDGGGGVLLHASASGTQDYACTAVTTDAGPGFAWAFVGPEADLANCGGQKIGKHFASDGGPGMPEWMTTADGTYVIAKRMAAFTPDGGGAIAWLLLREQSTGGAGLLAKTLYVQRLNTNGGLTPAAATCDQDAAGATKQVPYTADYYFFGPP
jgi:hypothetical protein